MHLVTQWSSLGDRAGAGSCTGAQWRTVVYCSGVRTNTELLWREPTRAVISTKAHVLPRNTAVFKASAAMPS